MFTYFGVFAGHPNCKQLERNVVYILIAISGLAMSVTSKSTMTIYHLIGRRCCSAISGKNACKRFISSILALI